MRHTILILILIVGLSLSGCGSVSRVVVPEIRVERPPGAGYLLTCAAEPTGGEIRTQADVAEHVVRLRAAGADCRDRLAAVRHIVEI